VDLVRDLLDKLVVDRHGREIGRVDAIAIELRLDAPPRVVGIDLGSSVLAYRVTPALGRLMRGIEHVLGMAEGRPLRIPFADILDIRDRIKVDRAAGETGVATQERRLRRWVAALPGSS
jgi:hypothetical protein